MMTARALVSVLLIFFVTGAGAQARFGTVERPAPGTPATQEKRPFAASPQRTPQAERCANFRRELRAARQQEREAGTTTGRDQTATHRQEIFAAMQKAGC
jgi:uncharacterized membrane protein